MEVGRIDREKRGEGVLVPERTIPAPTTVSAQAQAFLAFPQDMAEGSPPAADDKEAWRAHIATGTRC